MQIRSEVFCGKLLIDKQTNNYETIISTATLNKKLIRRSDSEHELFYDDIVHEFGEIIQNKGHYTVQGHSRSPILLPIESSYTTFY